MEFGAADLPDWAPVALAQAGEIGRPALTTLLALDTRLERIVHGATEPILAQVRMAWWREEIGRHRPDGANLPPDPLLSAILAHWGEQRTGLLALIEGWENLVGEPPWSSESHAAFCNGRALAFSAYAELMGERRLSEAASLHGAVWGAANLAQVDGGYDGRLQSLPRLPRRLRALAVIGGLSWRAVKRGGQPLLGDRMSPLVALRLGILGV